jgi:hypothetical protein
MQGRRTGDHRAHRADSRELSIYTLDTQAQINYIKDMGEDHSPATTKGAQPMTRLHNAAIPNAIVNGAVHVLGMIATGALVGGMAAITPSLAERCDAGDATACRVLSN